MRCISPLLIRKGLERNTVPCGACNFCLQTKRAEWSFRLSNELKLASSASFLTLTYEDTNIRYNENSGEQTLSKEDLQLFTKRLRKANAKFSDIPLRYYSVGEYGTKTSRPHYHSIMFNMHQQTRDTLSEIWSLGNTLVGTVTPASIHYVTKYVINRPGEYDGREPPFALMSRKPGIGSNYLATHTQWHRSNKANFTKQNGILGRLPRYYKDKIFSDFERQLMAAQLTSIGDDQYFKELERLSKYYADPAAAYDGRLAHEHATIQSKSNTSNKF